MENWLTPLTPEAAYRTVLTHRRVTNAEGWSRMEPVAPPAPTGCVIMDRVLHLLHTASCPPCRALASRMDVRPADLAGVIRIFTGMEPDEFIIAYRMLRAKELLSCTDLDVEEVARRSGYASAPAFCRSFSERCHKKPTWYRCGHRPDDFRERYRW